MGTDDAPVPEYAADYSPAPDDAPDASHLTPEEKRGPRTVHVALGLLAFLLIVAVATNPASVLPRDSTLHGEHHLDVDSGLELSVPVGWRVVSDAELGSLQIVPVGTGHALETRILAGALEPGIAAAAIADDQGAATALAETIQLYILGVSGIRDERRVTRVANDAGTGAAVSYVVVPDEFADLDSGGLVYTAVFGSEGRRWWVAYVTTAQQSAPGVKWMDKIVDSIRLPG
ncbi:hypothetical protein M3B38_14560 [Dietzia cinnamea]|uniref:hypothetical protein n=1 Tax=Dietzia TaxID=37914 RepID=UPI000D087C6D|nr:MULTISPECIES: hypothetical protein [Dietzia]AVM64264.1 hypothetical protein C3V38_07550 [Dietzia sp. oral taxon 368]MCT1713175.1 hypothetical protein [Dietzia cinnamea]